MHEAGNGPEDLRHALASIPILDGALSALQLAISEGAEVRILSDANTEYIYSILRARGIETGFSIIETNGAMFSETGRLRISPHGAHSCELCPPNLCKGAVLTRWLREAGDVRCIYVGDGNGDFCPATMLRAGDSLLARGKPHDALLKRCKQKRAGIKAQVVEWGEEDDGASILAGFTAFFCSETAK